VHTHVGSFTRCRHDVQELQRDFHHAVCEQHATQSNQRVQELRDEWRRQQKSTEEVVAEQYATHGPAQELLTALKEEWHAEQREHAKQAVTTVREELEGKFRRELLEQKEALREIVQAEVEDRHQLELTRLEVQLGEVATAAVTVVTPPRKSLRLAAATEERVRNKFVQPNPRKRAAYTMEE
jgi:predicted transcriptional regulator